MLTDTILIGKQPNVAFPMTSQQVLVREAAARPLIWPPRDPVGDPFSPSHPCQFSPPLGNF